MRAQETREGLGRSCSTPIGETPAKTVSSWRAAGIGRAARAEVVPMKLSRAMIARAMRLLPGVPGDRIVLDPRGIHHRTIPSKSFEHSVSNHAEVRKSTVAESLFVVEKLKGLGSVGPSTPVRVQGA